MLINTLFKEGLVKSLVSPIVNQKLHKDLFERSGEYLYPQIYIPRFQYLEDNSSLNRTEVDTTEELVYDFYSGDAEVDSAQNDEVWPGYKLINGAYEFYTMVDEDYANEHEVWVFSLNESPEYARPALPCDIDPCAPGCPLEGCTGGGGGGGGGEVDPDDDPTDGPILSRFEPFPELGHQKINFKLDEMRVYNGKEKWTAGKSEIAIKAKLVCHNGRVEGLHYPALQKEYSSDQFSNKLGKLIIKVKRKDVKDHTYLYPDYTLQANWQVGTPTVDPVDFMYIMFERDIWPARAWKMDKYARISPFYPGEPATDKFTLWIRSSQQYDPTPYGNHFFTGSPFLATDPNTYAGTGIVINSDIRYTTVIY